MAGELAHIDVGGELTKVEWEGIGTHLLNGQAADDLVYASSATQLSRLAVASSTIIAKLAAGGLVAATPAEIKTLLAYGTMAAETATNYVPKSLYDAYSILMATTDDTPIAITIAEQQVVGRITSGAIKGLSAAELLTLSGAATTATAIQAVEDTGLVMTTAKGVEFEAVPATHTADGIIVTMTAGTALVFSDACYVGTDGKLEKALADDAALTIPATHMAIATINENAEGLFLVKGWASDASWAFDVGKSVYLSAATAGLITKTMPTKVTGNQVQVLGTCLVADTIHWNPSMIVMEYV